MVMDADVPEIEAGGKGNFQYGDSPTSRYQPTKSTASCTMVKK